MIEVNMIHNRIENYNFPGDPQHVRSRVVFNVNRDYRCDVCGNREIVLRSASSPLITFHLCDNCKWSDAIKKLNQLTNPINNNHENSRS